MTDTHDDGDGFDVTANSHATLTQRLILAASPADGDEVDIAIDTDRDVIVAEVGDRPDCWLAIATRAVFYAAGYMSLYHGEDEAIADMQRQLVGTLDAASED